MPYKDGTNGRAYRDAAEAEARRRRAKSASKPRVCKNPKCGAVYYHTSGSGAPQLYCSGSCAEVHKKDENARRRKLKAARVSAAIKKMRGQV